MSLEYRIQRINKITESWGLEREHPLIASLPLGKQTFENFKCQLKLFISRALQFNYAHDDFEFVKNIDLNRKNRLNVTPNGAVVPKENFN